MADDAAHITHPRELTNEFHLLGIAKDKCASKEIGPWPLAMTQGNGLVSAFDILLVL